MRLIALLSKILGVLWHAIVLARLKTQAVPNEAFAQGIPENMLLLVMAKNGLKIGEERNIFEGF